MNLGVRETIPIVAGIRYIRVKYVENKLIKAFDSRYNKILSFRKDRVQKSKEI